jgi:hypothetical protein
VVLNVEKVENFAPKFFHVKKYSKRLTRCQLNAIFSCLDTHRITEDSVMVKFGKVPFADLVKYQGNSASLFAWRIGANTKFNNNQLMLLEDFGLKRAPQSWCYTRS